MPLKRYRVIVKVLCSTCLEVKKTGRINEDCPQCSFIKYRDVRKLTAFTAWLDKNRPDWVWFKVYEYKKGGAGRELATYKNWYKVWIKDSKGKWIFNGVHRSVPNTDQI